MSTQKTLFVFELHRSDEIVEFFKRCTPLFHQSGYRHIGYELGQEQAVRVCDPNNVLMEGLGRPSTRQQIHNIFMGDKRLGKTTGLDVPELSDNIRYMLNTFLTDHFTKIHLVREQHIFSRALESSQNTKYGSLNMVGCNHVGVLHQAIAHAVREGKPDLLQQYKFIFLVETGYPKPEKLFGTDLPAYPLDVLFIDTKKGLRGVEKTVQEYLDKTVAVPDFSVLEAIQKTIDEATVKQAVLYDGYFKSLCRVLDAAPRCGINTQTMMMVPEPFRGVISGVAKLTREAVQNNNTVPCLRSEVGDFEAKMLSAAGFQFAVAEKTKVGQAADAYRAKQFEQAEKLFEECLAESEEDSEAACTIQYNLASTCRELGKFERSLNLFYEAAQGFFKLNQKQSEVDKEKLAKYISRFVDLLNDHSDLFSQFKTESQNLFDIYNRAKLDDAELKTKFEIASSAGSRLM